jgi:hypothetical protein
MVQTLLGSGVLAEVNNGNTTDISDVRGQTFTSSFNFKVLNLHILIDLCIYVQQLLCLHLLPLKLLF